MSSKFVIYTSEKFGCDETGDGTEAKPFATVKKAISTFEGESSLLQICTDSADHASKFSNLSKTQLKKAMKELSFAEKKAQTQSQLEKDKQTQREKNLQDAKSISITMDTSLPKPLQTRISGCAKLIDTRVKVFGWVTSIRRQGKTLMFIILRDGTGCLQCVFSDLLCQTYNALMLSSESSVCVYGKIKKIPDGKTAPGGIELVCDYWDVIGLAPAGGVEAVLNTDANPDTQLNFRHLQLRTDEMIDIMKVRSHALQAFRSHYLSKGYFEVTPPTLVQTQCEGGGSLFKLPFFGEEAYLTQSSQLYLETVIPSLGCVFAMAQSYRAETSKTRRHLAEYTHIEGEIPFIDFPQLLEEVEDLICDVLKRILDSEVGDIVRKMHPELKPFKRPFKRMQYTEALEYLKAHDIRKEDGTFYEFPDDIPEAPERKMTDEIGEPIFLCRFPAVLKSFYMSKEPTDTKLTESMDLLLPGVGEVVGGSMRMTNEEELLLAYKKEGIDSAPYYWYTEQRRYGTCTHGGYGLGFERYLTWLLARYHIRDVCLYPRFVGRCTP